MSDSVQGAKLFLTYDVIPEAVGDYFRFFVGQYIPVMQRKGLEVLEAWQTAYGTAPDRLIGFVSPQKETALALLHDDIWLQLNQELQKYVTNFSYKVTIYREGFYL